jgi:hypothetical protein
MSKDGLLAAFEQIMDGARLAIPDALHHPICQYMRRAILDNKILSRTDLQNIWEAFYYGWHSREIQSQVESGSQNK